MVHGRGGRSRGGPRRRDGPLNPFAHNAAAEQNHRREDMRRAAQRVPSPTTSTPGLVTREHAEELAHAGFATGGQASDFRKGSSASDFRKDDPLPAETGDSTMASGMGGADEPLRDFIERTRREVQHLQAALEGGYVEHLLRELDLRGHLRLAIHEGRSECTVDLPDYVHPHHLNVTVAPDGPTVDHVLARLKQHLEGEGVVARTGVRERGVCCTNPQGPDANGECTLCGSPYQPHPILRFVLECRF
jgi:hypothetical protein